ncbi:hypothetical protein U6A24_04685 [Aquimarina gracilis]|uniref:Outer membrane protein beta-barrel domain-containing protein n=1 Tax=Aquimarina gracilis TaxID=874422 RepID=A0ABU5ZRM9_9FLAO|nr:hypothetical protein [Aquimarina gracilis]MEB3344741.1 hypothetical protein [Aquimarina gracilis]
MRNNHSRKLQEGRGLIFNVFVLLSCIGLYGQEQNDVEEGSTSADSKLTITDFAYPRTWLSSEQHASFTMNYKIKPGLFFELQGDYDTYLLADVFRMPFVTKLYISDKLYLLSGIELEMERDKMQIDLPPPQLKFKNGWGYDIRSNFSLEVEYDLHFNKSIYGAYGTPSLLSVHGKFRF